MDTLILDMDHLIRDALMSKMCTHTCTHTHAHTHARAHTHAHAHTHTHTHTHTRTHTHTHTHFKIKVCISFLFTHVLLFLTHTDVHLQFAKGKHHRPGVWKALAKPQRNPDEHREIQLGKRVYKDADKESHCTPHTRRLFIWVWENGTCKPWQTNCIWCLILFLWCHGCQAVICAHHMSVISRRLHPDSLSKHLSLSQKFNIHRSSAHRPVWRLISSAFRLK